MATTAELFANNAQTTLAGAITNTALSLNVSPGSGVLFPAPNNANGQFFRLSLTDAATTLKHEIVYVTAVSTDTFTIIRAQEGTTAQPWSAGDIAMNAWTAGAAANMTQAAAAIALQGNYQNTSGYTTAQTLTVSQLGAALLFLGSTAVTWTLPSAATIKNGGSFSISNQGTGTLTIAVNGGSDQIVGSGLSSTTLVLAPGDDVDLVGSASTNVYALMGAALRKFNPLGVGKAATASQAAQLGQMTGVIGDRRSLVCSIPTTSATATFLATQIVVGVSVGGLMTTLNSLNASINLGTVGAGGMDVSGLPATANVAIYAIYNPVTGATALLGWNASSYAGLIYPGSAMPAGYTQSALLAVLLVTSSLFTVCYVQDRHTTINQTSQISTGSSSSTNVNLSLGVPINALNAELNVTFSCTTATNANVAIGATSTGTMGTASFQVASGQAGSMYKTFALPTAQQVWYSISNSAGTPTTTISLTGWSI